MINTRNPRSGSAGRISPLVDIQGRIANQSDTVLFTVQAATPSYWRLTALDEFDGRIWSSARTYRDASGELSGGLEDGHSTTLEQQYTILGLSSIWYPAAFAPTEISIGGEVRYDPETSSIVTKSGETAEGEQYTVVSQIPNLTPNVLQAANGPAPADISTHYTALPANFPADLRQLATDITANGSTVYEKSLLLQNWFRRNFTYDLDVQRGHGINAIESFLAQRKGYCEQFAGTFAAFARSLGLPARVAVGFTQGTQGPDGLFQVEGKHAHAWPEVYFSGIGWVPFEPTPTRGAPGDEVFTGVPQQQVGEQPQSTSTTVAQDTTGGTSVTVSPLAPDGDLGLGNVPIPDFGSESGLVSGSSGGRSWVVTAGIVLLVLLVLAGIWILVVPRLISGRWGRRRRAATTQADHVLVGRGTRPRPPSPAPACRPGPVRRRPSSPPCGPPEPHRRRHPRTPRRPRHPGGVLGRRRRAGGGGRRRHDPRSGRAHPARSRRSPHQAHVARRSATPTPAPPGRRRPPPPPRTVNR